MRATTLLLRQQKRIQDLFGRIDSDVVLELVGAIGDYLDVLDRVVRPAAREHFDIETPSLRERVRCALFALATARPENVAARAHDVQMILRRHALEASALVRRMDGLEDSALLRIGMQIQAVRAEGLLA
jgi:hypothetical protein